MSADPKAGLVEGKVRLLTIHDGTRLTSTVIRLLDVIADAGALVDELPAWESGQALPVLVSRSDGLAVYIDPRSR